MCWLVHILTAIWHQLVISVTFYTCETRASAAVHRLWLSASRPQLLLLRRLDVLSGAMSRGPFDATGSTCITVRIIKRFSVMPLPHLPSPSPVSYRIACMGVSTQTSIVVVDGDQCTCSEKWSKKDVAFFVFFRKLVFSGVTSARK